MLIANNRSEFEVILHRMSEEGNLAQIFRRELDCIGKVEGFNAV